MAIRRRSTSVFNLSFLDVMSCGFGAVILVFLIIDHRSHTQGKKTEPTELSETRFIERDVREGELDLVELTNTIAAISERLAIVQGEAERVVVETEVVRKDYERFIAQSAGKTVTETELRAEIETLEKELEEMRANEGSFSGTAARDFVGEGDRQYLTGLPIGGDRILILLDVSASMMDETLVNVLRRRNMSDQERRMAPKWRRSLATVDWLISQMPIESQFQIIVFNTEARAALSGTDGQWLPIIGGKELSAAVDALRDIVPDKGTSLENAFLAASRLSPAPDNVYLITDGLPTQGRTLKSGGLIDGEDRAELFADAMEQIPKGALINSILMPMDGDPTAAASYWILSQRTGGTFMAPARDWP